MYRNLNNYDQAKDLEDKMNLLVQRMNTDFEQK
jgi:hypothetical protein